MVIVFTTIVVESMELVIWVPLLGVGGIDRAVIVGVRD